MYYFTDISIDAVMMEKGISATAARVLYHVNRFIHASRMKGIKDGRGIPYSYASREAIAARVGKSARTVARAIAELKAAGLIEVQRTRRNAHIFMCYYGACGTSAAAENGTSNNSNTKNINNISAKSIRLHNTEAVPGQISVDGFINSASAMAENTPQEPPREAQRPAPSMAANRDRTKGRPTPKRPQRPTMADRERARQRYKDHLTEALRLDDLAWGVFPEEYKRLDTLSDMIADAMSIEGGQIKVNGCYLTAAQYWEVVQHIQYNENIARLFDRIETREVCHGIVNKRAYALASVYNAVQWDHLTQGAEVDRDALYRAAAVG